VRKHYTKAQRAELIDLVTSGQTTTRRAAARLGVAESTAYYWLKRARGSLALAVRQTGSSRTIAKTRPTFVRLIAAAEMCPPITLRAGGVVIEVQPGFDHALLRDVVAALAERTP
jgi:transposase-like protein